MKTPDAPKTDAPGTGTTGLFETPKTMEPSASTIGITPHVLLVPRGDTLKHLEEREGRTRGKACQGQGAKE